jgi:hypothetical protein
MKNGNFGINDDGITGLLRQVKCSSQITRTEHMIATEKRVSCAVCVTLEIDGNFWSAVASVGTNEFEKSEWEDRRKFHLAQMAMTRAKNNALMSALGITNADVNDIAKELGVIGDTKNKFQDDGPVPDVPEEIEKPKSKEDLIAEQKAQEALRMRMKKQRDERK